MDHEIRISDVRFLLRLLREEPQGTVELPWFGGHLTKPDNGLGGVDGSNA